MKKEKRKAFRKKIYLLGKDTEGVKYWLEEASWDCNWYYGFGYIETYTNNNFPEKSRDINSHEHYDTKILKNGFTPEEFKKIFPETPLNNSEIWKLNELMETFYTLKKYHAMLHTGGSHVTTNSISKFLKNDAEYERLKNIVFPALFEKIYTILSPEEED